MIPGRAGNDFYDDMTRMRTTTIMASDINNDNHNEDDNGMKVTDYLAF